MDRLGRLSPGMALLLLAPICGELLSGHQTLFEFINPLALLIVFGVLQDFDQGFGGAVVVAAVSVWAFRKLWLSTQARYAGVGAVTEGSLLTDSDQAP